MLKEEKTLLHCFLVYHILSIFVGYKEDLLSCLTFKCFIINDLFKRSGKHV